MDSRRVPRSVIDPKVRQVGFFAPPDRAQSGPPAPLSSSPPVSDLSPASNSLSPVMIPPPRHVSADLFRHFPHPPFISPLRVASRTADSLAPVGSYYPSEFQSPMANADFAEEQVSTRFGRKGSFGKIASSLPAAGFSMALAKERVRNLPSDEEIKAEMPEDQGSALTKPLEEKKAQAEMPKEQGSASSKPLKERTTKAERRAIQEAQRAAKVSSKGEGSKSSATAPGGNQANATAGKSVKAVSQKKDNSSVAVSEEKGVDRKPDKDGKIDATKVGRAKKRSVVKQTEAKNRVELFRHLPQYKHGTQLPELELKFFQLDSVHPAVYKVGLSYLSGDISGGNARCTAMLQAFQEAIKDYTMPPDKSLIRDLTTKINSYISFLIECRPLSISMGNAIRFLKSRIAHLPLNLSESEAKANLISGIDLFISEKITLANKVIVKHAVTKIRDNDVLLTYGSSSSVESLLLHAHELGRRFHVVIVDSRPKLEGLKLLRRLVGKGVSCTYTHMNAISYVMHEVTLVFLGAASVLSNGTVYSRVGTACVAMVAHRFEVPVLVCCEAYKFHERVQLDSICCNELGDPDAISKVFGRREIKDLDGWADCDNLQLLNLTYDATPSDYVSMIITDHGMIPATSIPVIVREYRKEHLWP